MKKYTIYEIEKLTNGKLTKYKLNQAIENNQLEAERIEGTKKGRGVPKYLVQEDKLQAYINELESNKRNRLILPDETKENHGDLVKASHLIKEKEELIKDQKNFLEEVSNRIHLLQTEKTTDESTDELEKKKSEERRQIIMELASVSIFSFKRKKELLSRLNQLA